MGRKKLLVVIALMLGINLTHISMIATNKDSRENKQMLSNHNTEDQTQEHIPQGIKYISEKPMMAMRSIPEVKEEKQSDKTVAMTTGKTITIQKPKEEWIDVEVSHYSDLQYVDGNGDGAKNCIGGYLREGDYAFPYEYPIGTKFKIRFQDGTEEYGVVMDRGNKNYVRKYSRGEIEKKGAMMKIDRFMKGLSNEQVYKLGIVKAKIMIIEE